MTMISNRPLLPAAAVKNQETCADPGDCGAVATRTVRYRGLGQTEIVLGYCDWHAPIAVERFRFQQKKKRLEKSR
jgi:hypothetical protein